jgi:hypothetical protein
MTAKTGNKYAEGHGRPSVYVEEMDEYAWRILARGYSKRACAAILGISHQTLYAWANKNSPQYKQSFSDAISLGYARGRMYWEKIGKDLCSTKEKQPGEPRLYRGSAGVWMWTMAVRYGWRSSRR